MKTYYFVRRAASPDPKHETLAAAQSVAEKMAESEPGSAFEILRCVGIAQCSKASTFWMDVEEQQPEWRYFQDLDAKLTYYRVRGGVIQWASTGCPDWDETARMASNPRGIPASELPPEIKP